MTTATSTAYGDRQAAIYDTVYGSRGKDWSDEADSLAALIRRHCPDARSVLDVACGTGNHLVRLAELFETADGVDLSGPMLAIAAEKVPSAALRQGDMREFDLGRTYDAVVLMCFSVAYSRDVAQLRATVGRLAAHARPGGVVVVEPWWFPERFRPGYVIASAVNRDGRAIARTSRSVRDGDFSRMTIHYTVADADGIEDFAECEVHRLFSRQEYLDAFAAAGLTAEYHEGGPTGRGLFVAPR